MTPLEISEAQIRQRVGPTLWQRGEEYYRRGAVVSMVRRGEALQAEVEGSDVVPYRVHITLGREGPLEAVCSCPYGAEWGGWCKHIVAVLLAAARQSLAIDEESSLEELLAGLDREQLRQLVVRLVEGRPDLYDPVAGAVAVLRAQAAAPARADARSAPVVDRAVVRQRVRGILRGTDGLRASEAYWMIGGLVDGVREVLGEAQALLEAGEGRGALTVLEAITDEYVRGWEMLDDSNGELSDFFPDLATMWTEALLTADLTPEERADWEEMLAGWDDEVAEYFEPVFGAAREAAREGWDDPELLRVLGGEGAEPELDEPDQEGEDNTPWYPDELTDARLNVLERQERFVEALRLAEAEGYTLRALLLLIRLGRIAEAVERGVRSLAAPGDALRLARELREWEAVAEALRIGEHGLELEPAGEWNPGPRKAELAAWVRDLAAEQRRPELALRAARVAVRSVPDLAGYLRLRELAGDTWPEWRQEVLDEVRRNRRFPSGAVEILLHEGLPADALDVVEGGWDTPLLAQVVEAAAEVVPERVIPICRRHAEEVMDAGRSTAYHHAVEWLRRARTAYRAAGRQAQWNEYLDGLIGAHQRKYKLRPMLEALRKD